MELTSVGGIEQFCSKEKRMFIVKIGREYREDILHILVYPGKEDAEKDLVAHGFRKRKYYYEHDPKKLWAEIQRPDTMSAINIEVKNGEPNGK